MVVGIDCGAVKSAKRMDAYGHAGSVVDCIQVRDRRGTSKRFQ